ncbi:hypothetical protein EVAR_9825_1 [Eumeta japonica]|uniref:Uncharacterized protein n=1 Tax=Eumeta variegata TaxID=151549 RepID=A0A4C1U5U8_EUMVA|nr:hypothetical protein EVAR_9825_1 [Eumeta japonica]
MLRPTRQRRENEPAKPVRYHTLTKYRREIASSAVVFRPISEGSSGPFSPSSDILFLPKRLARHRTPANSPLVKVIAGLIVKIAWFKCGLRSIVFASLMRHCDLIFVFRSEVVFGPCTPSLVHCWIATANNSAAAAKSSLYLYKLNFAAADVN